MRQAAIDDSARRRLREAQLAESRALRACGAAESSRAAVLAKLQDAEGAVSSARRELIRVSGVERAAVLMQVPVAELRRLGRASATSDASSTGDPGPNGQA
jgi:hypothetical protein